MYCDNKIKKNFIFQMNLNKASKFSLGILVALPFSFIISNETLANHLSEKFEYDLVHNDLLACGGGGGGSSPAAKAAKKAKQAKAKLSFKKRQMSKMAAAGEDTSKLEAEIAELEALIAK